MSRFQYPPPGTISVGASKIRKMESFDLSTAQNPNERKVAQNGEVTLAELGC